MIHADPSGISNANLDDYPDDLTRIDELNEWQIETGRTDPRGYDLIGSDGEKLGTIRSLLVSPSQQRAYAAVVDAGNWFHHKLFVVPLDLLQIDSGLQQASASFTKIQFQQAPEYPAGDRDYVRSLGYWDRFRTVSAPEPAAQPVASADRADRAPIGDIRVPVTEETAQVRKEQREAGYITIRKRVDVETQHISEPVTRTRVVTENRAVPPGEAYDAGPGATTLREGETLRVPVTEEKLVVQKVPRVTEEVVVHMQPETEQVEQDIQLRHEHVDVDEEGEIEVDEVNPAGGSRQP